MNISSVCTVDTHTRACINDLGWKWMELTRRKINAPSLNLAFSIQRISCNEMNKIHLDDYWRFMHVCLFVYWIGILYRVKLTKICNNQSERKKIHSGALKCIIISICSLAVFVFFLSCLNAPWHYWTVTECCVTNICFIVSMTMHVIDSNEVTQKTHKT